MKNVVQTGFYGGGQADLSSPLEFLGGLESVESESLPIKGGCMSVPVSSRKEPLTLTLSRRSRKIQASLGKGGGTEVPEGLRKFTQAIQPSHKERG